jgi:NitT/TauT family transport system ATP-binding protein
MAVTNDESAVVSPSESGVPDAGGELITIDGVTKTFITGTGSVHALSETSLAIKEEEFVALVGPSGCGKTTLLRMLADLEQPTEGSIRIDAEHVSQMRKRRELGFVFQQASLLEWRSVADNVRLPLELGGAPRANRRERVAQALELVGLEGFADKRPRELSGGMQQRVSLARALITHPRVLLMDEPFGALDEITRDRLNVELGTLVTKARTTVVFVTHSIREAVFLSDRVVVMSPRPGRVLGVIDVDLPRPRSLSVREDERFNELSIQGLRLLEAGFQQSPAEPLQ